MRVLFLTSTFLKSKSDEQLDFVYEFVSAFKRKGHEVMVLAAHDWDVPKEHFVDGIRVRRFQYFWPARLQRIAYGAGIAQNISQNLLAKIQFIPYIVSNSLAIRKAVKDFKPDVVQALWSFPQGWSAAFAKKAGNFKLAMHLFGAEIYLAQRYKMPFLAKWPTGSADLLTANSEATKEAAVEIGIREPTTIFCGGVNTQRYNPGNSGKAARKKHGLGKEPIIFVMGRLVERKGHVYLVRAMPSILKKFPKAKLVIGGGGPEEKGIREEIEKQGVQDSVIMTGRVPIPLLPSYYAACDVFCLPAIVDSRGETEGGQGLVLSEAMASGKAVVASNVGGIPDAVQHNVNGLLVKQKNPKELAAAICRVLADKRLAARLAKGGKRFVEETNSYDVVVDRFVELYNGIGKNGKVS